MVGVQQACARIGRVTGKGLAGNMLEHSRRWLYPVVGLLVLANVVNLAADIAAMGAAMQMVAGGPQLAWAGLCTAGSLLLEVLISYPRYVKVLKWLTLSLFAYVAAMFTTHVSWGGVVAGLVPHVHLGATHLSLLVAILGTTISPYLLFWQASQEAEDEEDDPAEKPLRAAPDHARGQLRRIRIDTWVGMVFSQVVAICILICAAATLNAAGITDIQSAPQAAEALRPVAGRFAFLLFALGIVGTGLLAIPVLAGSAAFAVGEAMRWPVGLELKYYEAKGFYGVLGAATILGFALNAIGVNPMKALVLSAVVNGVCAVPILVVTMRLGASRAVMGPFVFPRRLRVTGWVATAVMGLAAVGMFATLGK